MLRASGFLIFRYGRQRPNRPLNKEVSVMLTPYQSPRKRGRKRALLSLFAALSGLVGWQQIEGLGLGDRPERGHASRAHPEPAKRDPSHPRPS